MNEEVVVGDGDKNRFPMVHTSELALEAPPPHVTETPSR